MASEAEAKTYSRWGEIVLDLGHTSGAKVPHSHRRRKGLCIILKRKKTRTYKPEDYATERGRL